MTNSASSDTQNQLADGKTDNNFHSHLTDESEITSISIAFLSNIWRATKEKNLTLLKAELTRYNHTNHARWVSLFLLENTLYNMSKMTTVDELGWFIKHLVEHSEFARINYNRVLCRMALNGDIDSLINCHNLHNLHSLQAHHECRLVWDYQAIKNYACVGGHEVILNLLNEWFPINNDSQNIDSFIFAAYKGNHATLAAKIIRSNVYNNVDNDFYEQLQLLQNVHIAFTNAITEAIKQQDEKFFYDVISNLNKNYQPWALSVGIYEALYQLGKHNDFSRENLDWTMARALENCHQPQDKLRILTGILHVMNKFAYHGNTDALLIYLAHPEIKGLLTIDHHFQAEISWAALGHQEEVFDLLLDFATTHKLKVNINNTIAHAYLGNHIAFAESQIHLETKINGANQPNATAHIDPSDQVKISEFVRSICIQYQLEKQKNSNKRKLEDNQPSGVIKKPKPSN